MFIRKKRSGFGISALPLSEMEINMESKYKNKQEKKLLTISLLVSNRKDTIRKCMESIKPLLEALPSELIAVDTGCTDGSIEIVKEYADLVVDFPWCHDFAAARNAGLEKAQGEWFLYLDDDEWFEDVTEIIQFFQSGEYKQYDRAWYIVRNYADWEGKTYKESGADRVYKRVPQAHFVGKVHEVYKPTGSKIKHFSCYAHHYGYVYKNEEAQKKHAERNISLLKKELTENPNDVRMIAQLIQEYIAIGEFEEARKWRKDTLARCKPEQCQHTIVQYIITSPLYIFRKEKNEEAVEQLVQEIMDIYPLTTLSKLVCIVEQILVLASLKKSKEVLHKLPEYFSTYDMVKASDNNKEDGYFDRLFYKSEGLYQDMVVMGFRAAVSQKQKTLIGEYLQKLEQIVGKEAFAEKLRWYADILRKWYIRGEDEGLLFSYYKDFLDNQQTKEDSYNKLEELLLKYPRKRMDLAEGFEPLQRTEPVFVFLHLLYRLQHDCAEERKQALREYFSMSKGKFDAYVVAFCLEQDNSVNELLHYIDLETFKNGVAIWQREHDRSLSVNLEQLENGWDKKYVLYFAYVKLAEFERRLLEVQNNVTSALLEYVDAFVSYASLYYAKTLLQEENWCVLPRDCQFVLCVKKAFDAKEKDCNTEWTEYMKKAAKVYPAKVSILQRVLKEEVKRAEAAKIPPEMRQLAEELKKNVRELIAAGEYLEAKNFIQALKEYVPDDEEIKELEKLLFVW